MPQLDQQPDQQPDSDQPPVPKAAPAGRERRRAQRGAPPLNSEEQQAHQQELGTFLSCLERAAHNQAEANAIAWDEGQALFALRKSGLWQRARPRSDRELEAYLNGVCKQRRGKPYSRQTLQRRELLCRFFTRERAMELGRAGIGHSALSEIGRGAEFLHLDLTELAKIHGTEELEQIRQAAMAHVGPPPAPAPPVSAEVQQARARAAMHERSAEILKRKARKLEEELSEGRCPQCHQALAADDPGNPAGRDAAGEAEGDPAPGQSAGPAMGAAMESDAEWAAATGQDTASGPPGAEGGAAVERLRRKEEALLHRERELAEKDAQAREALLSAAKREQEAAQRAATLQETEQALARQGATAEAQEKAQAQKESQLAGQKAELANREQGLSAREQDLAAREHSLGAREARAALLEQVHREAGAGPGGGDLQGAVEQRFTEALALQAEVRAAEQALAQHQALLRDQEQAISRLRAEAQAQAQAAAALWAQAASAQAAAEARAAALADKEQALAEDQARKDQQLGQAYAAKEEMLTAQLAQMEQELWDPLTRKEQELVREQLQVEAATQELATRQRDIADKEQALADRERDLLPLKQEMTDKITQLDAEKQEIGELHKELLSQQRELVSARQAAWEAREEHRAQCHELAHAHRVDPYPFKWNDGAHYLDDTLEIMCDYLLRVDDLCGLAVEQMERDGLPSRAGPETVFEVWAAAQQCRDSVQQMCQAIGQKYDEEDPKGARVVLGLLAAYHRKKSGQGPPGSSGDEGGPGGAGDTGGSHGTGGMGGAGDTGGRGGTGGTGGVDASGGSHGGGGASSSGGASRTSSSARGTAARAGAAELTDLPGAHDYQAPPAVLAGTQNVRTPQHGILGLVPALTASVVLCLNEIQCINILGLQNAGKSSTILAILEMMLGSIPRICRVPKPLGVVYFHSGRVAHLPGVVQSSRPNAEAKSVRFLREELGALPQGIPPKVVLVPRMNPDKMRQRQAEWNAASGQPVEVRAIELSPAEITTDDIRILMAAGANASIYMSVLEGLIRELDQEGRLGLPHLLARVEANPVLTTQGKNLIRARCETLQRYLVGTTRVRDLLKPGQMVIVDMRDDFTSKVETMALFTVLMRTFSAATDGLDAQGQPLSFNKVVIFDEAHRYMEQSEITDLVIENIREMRHNHTWVILASQDAASIPKKVNELSTVTIVHRIQSPKELKLLQEGNAGWQQVKIEDLKLLAPGEAYVLLAVATDRQWVLQPHKVVIRPSCAMPGGTTRPAVAEAG